MRLILEYTSQFYFHINMTLNYEKKNNICWSFSAMEDISKINVDLKELQDEILPLVNQTQVM
jgi:hypothetical protein